MAQLREALDALLSTADHEARAWRHEVTRSMRKLMEADRAVLSVFRRPGGAGATRGHIGEELFGGIAHPEALEVTLWSRRLLRRRNHRLGSYLKEFARPQDLRDVLGASLCLEGSDAQIRLALIYSREPLSPERFDLLLSRLSLMLPALRTGLGMHLRMRRWLLNLPAMLDKIGQRLALFTPAGREIYRNASMRRTLAEDPEHSLIEAALVEVARMTVCAPPAGSCPPRIGGFREDPSRREFRTTTARYRLRGSVMDPGTVGPERTVLVSMDRLRTEPPAAEPLRGLRFGLTLRETQVASLLMQRLTNKEIATILGISAHTARHHTESVLMKAGVNSRRALRRALAGAGS
jgi:DNA-binding CsgD family transcriptional regulator